MQIHIRGQECQIIDCQENETIAQIKTRIRASQDFQCQLYCAGNLLTDDVCISELPSDTLELNISLLGGKVHGSLARAGKVKGQTPKVEKQEKKKKELDAPNGESSTTADSSTSFRPSAADEVQMPIPMLSP